MELYEAIIESLESHGLNPASTSSIYKDIRSKGFKISPSKLGGYLECMFDLNIIVQMKVSPSICYMTSTAYWRKFGITPKESKKKNIVVKNVCGKFEIEQRE